MLKGIAGQILLALTLTMAVPMAVVAQQSGRIGVSVRVVQSAVPETVATTTSQLARIAEADGEVHFAKSSIATERGLAQIITENLTDKTDPVGPLAPAMEHPSSESALSRVMITVAFTAN